MDHDPEAASNKPAGSVKELMRLRAAENPEEAARRLATRQRKGEQRKFMARLSDLISTQEMITKAAERLKESLDATVAVVVSDAKGAGQIQMVPDNKTRLEAIKVVAAYTEGLPVARQMIVHDFLDLNAAKRELLLSDPVIQESLDELNEELGLGPS